MKVLIIGLLGSMFFSVSCKETVQDSAGSTSAVQSTKNVEYKESDMSVDFAQLRTKFLALKSKDEVNGFMDYLKAKVADSNTATDVRFTGSLLLILKPMESMINRSITLVNSQRNLHSMLLSIIMGSAVTQRNLLPEKPIEALFKYVTEPQTSPDTTSKGLIVIDSMDKVQAQLGVIANSLLASYNVIKSLDVTKEAVLFDNKIAYGPGSFNDGIKRFYRVGEAEKQATLASLKMSIHGIKVFSAYNLDDLPVIIQKLGKVVGLDGFIGDIDGFPSCHKTGVINRYSKFWTLKNKGNMTSALVDLKTSFDHAKKSWDLLKQRDGGNDQDLKAFDQYFYNPGNQSLWSFPNSKAVENMVAMTKGQHLVRSSMTGEEVMVDMPAFYNNPPQDLKALLPTKFVGECDKSNKYLYTKNNEDSYRDYLWGSPTGWNMAAYSSYIKNGKTPLQAQRAMTYQWGGWLGAPLFALVN